MWFWFAFAFSLHASNSVTYPPQAFPAAGVEKIRVEGVRGDVSFKEVAGRAFRVKVKHGGSGPSDDWHLVIERRQNVLHVEVFNVLFGSDWEKHVKKELWPDFDLEIEGPSRPLILSWRDGSFEFNQWKAPIEASLLHGSVRVNGGGPRIGIQAVEADVQVRNFSGELHLQGERGPVRIHESKGVFKLNWLSGLIELVSVDGQLNFDSASGDLKAVACKGGWEIKASSGHIEVAGFEGTLKGKGDSSLWKVSASGRSDVEVITQTGPVDVQWPTGGTKLFLSSHQGRIRVPRPFRIQNREGLPFVEGKKGVKPLGQLFVRTSSGTISFR